MNPSNVLSWIINDYDLYETFAINLKPFNRSTLDWKDIELWMYLEHEYLNRQFDDEKKMENKFFLCTNWLLLFHSDHDYY